MVRADLGNEISFQDIEHIKLYANSKDAKERLNSLELSCDSFGEGNYKLYLNYRSGLVSQEDEETNNVFSVGYVNKEDIDKIKR